MGRDSPRGLLTFFDRPPSLPVSALNVDLSAVTKSADLVLGLGEPLQEIVQIDFQSRGAAWKHADLFVYNALLHARYHVPVHTIIILLRPEAAHANLNGTISYAPRPGRGKIDFSYEVVRLWECPAQELLSADPGIVPLALLGQLPADVPLEEGLAAIAQRVVDRVINEVAPDRARKLLTEALLLTGLRVSRETATRIFHGVHAMEESDTYLMILERGEEKATRDGILVIGEERLGTPEEGVRARLAEVTDLQRLKRMHRRAVKAANWQEILEIP